MNKSVIKYINRLEGFKTACKNMHFSADSMSEHKLFDEIAELLAEKQDEIGEIEQGIHGQFDKKTIKGDGYSTDSSKKFIQDLILATKDFYKKIKGERYIGMRSAVEDFLSKLDKQPYLLDLCLKEDFKRSYKRKLNEASIFSKKVKPDSEFEFNDNEKEELDDILNDDSEASIQQVDYDMLDDAIEALEMSDGQIDYYEWSAAYPHDDETTLLGTWNQACQETGFEMLKEEYSFYINDNDLKSCIQEAMQKVMHRYSRIF